MLKLHNSMSSLNNTSKQDQKTVDAITCGKAIAKLITQLCSNTKIKLISISVSLLIGHSEAHHSNNEYKIVYHSNCHSNQTEKMLYQKDID